MKNFRTFLHNIFFVIGIFFIFTSIGNIGNTIQFQEVDLDKRFLLYFPIIIILILWIFCIFKYFKPVATSKKTKPFAIPNSSVYKSVNYCEEKHYIRTFSLLGTFIGVIVSLFLLILIEYIYAVPYDDPSYLLNKNRYDLRREVESTLVKISNRFESYIEDNMDKLQPTTTNWQNVFKSKLECFESEHKALKNIQELIEKDKKHVPNSQSQNDPTSKPLSMRNYLIVTEPYEFKIESSDPFHFKMRYNTPLQEILDFDPIQDQKFVYDGINKEFNVTGRWERKFDPYTDNNLYSSEVGILEYDSKTKECRFIYDNWWDNIKENYKWVIFLADFLLMFSICFAVFLTCRRIRKLRMISLTELKQ